MKLTTEQIREKFFEMYEDEWDFSHQNIEKGDEYYYFLRDNNLLDQYKDTLSKGNFPIIFLKYLMS